MEFAGLIFTFILAFGIAVSMILASFLFGPKIKNSLKNSPFECGMPPAQNPAVYLSNNFYKVALLLIVFDIEAVLLYPWAVSFKILNSVAFYSGMIFIAVLSVALLYALKRGFLRWD